MAEPSVSEEGPVHPMAEGSEAYYTYRSGEPVAIKLADGRVINLRELEVRPREPKWNLMVGSMWFDAASGQLVRRRRLTAPGEATGWEALLAMGWPGERVLAGAAATRVRVAISTLRRMGLAGFLLTRDDGYLLDPRASVVRAADV